MIAKIIPQLKLSNHFTIAYKGSYLNLNIMFHN